MTIAAMAEASFSPVAETDEAKPWLVADKLKRWVKKTSTRGRNGG